MGRDECPPYSHPEWPHPLNDSYGPPRGWENGHTKSEWTIIMFMVAIAFACLMFLTAAFLYYQYVRRHDAGESRRRRRLRNSSREAEQNFLASFTEGLGGTMVDALPVFVYTPENFKDGLRCAVCLCEFQQSEKGRLLPSCNHSFHVDCIGMWFYSHSTCPLCRTKVEKQSDASVELGHRQMEASVVEEVEEEEGGGGEKVVLGSTSASPEAEQHYNGGVKQKDDGICDHSKEENGDHVFIDLEHQRKLTSSSITS